MQAENTTMKMSAKPTARRQCAVVNQVMGFQEWALIVILSILWGGSFFFIGVTVKEMPPLTIVAGRVGLAAVLLWACIYLRGGKVPFSRGLWGAFFVMGAVNNVVPFCLIAIDGRLVHRFKSKRGHGFRV